ncbi:unnamed protein product [Rotaria sordida]|uniref:Uncharacterized protein n=1 Tax=Rotaria sordida TaxID=392033 RepID=A0A815J6C4_9BILA|nr:unnamed protein product [Rotaria sordida]
MSLKKKVVNLKNRDTRPWAIEFDDKYVGEINRLRQQFPSFYNKLIEFFTFSPDVTVGGHRVFPLMGENYRGAWEYKVSVRKRTCRIFYVLDTAHRTVLIYYVGPKPNKIPFPPTISSSELDNDTSSPYNNHRLVNKKGKAQRQ